MADDNWTKLPTGRPTNNMQDWILEQNKTVETPKCAYGYHDWVDVGFNFTKWVCKHCNIDKPKD